MSKARAFLRSQGVHDMVDDSTLDSEVVGLLRDIKGFFVSVSNVFISAINYVSQNWQLLIVGAVALFLINRHR